MISNNNRPNTALDNYELLKDFESENGGMTFLNPFKTLDENDQFN